ncbi:hypothetical protein [Streptomyces sp. NRRL F-5630]|uniref:hypothetical protein n=1 Tax=Streptomyces sp. NRRL F-5630 TaxID=1463864 RepID=UPI003D7462DB
MPLQGEDDALTPTATATEVRETLHGPGVPDWHVHKHTAPALFSLPSDMRPLWQAAPHHTTAPAHTTTTSSSALAEHFG